MKNSLSFYESLIWAFWLYVAIIDIDITERTNKKSAHSFSLRML